MSTDVYAKMTVDTSDADELECLQGRQQAEEPLQSTETAEGKESAQDTGAVQQEELSQP